MVRPRLSVSSWDPEIEKICCTVETFRNKDSPQGPPPWEGEVRSLSPEEQFPPSLGWVGWLWLPARAGQGPLSLLLCSREPLAKVASKKRTVWDTGTSRKQTLSASPLVNYTHPEVALLDHKCGHCMTQRICGDLCRSDRKISCGS